MQPIHWRTWAPPPSPVRIEYSTTLLRELRRANAGGVLWGFRNGSEICVLGTRRRPGLEPVGIFFVRVRGEVFLTEPDLEVFESCNVAVALVVAGAKAGFFVREADGSIDSIKSHCEFTISNEPDAALTQPKTVMPARWTRLALAWFSGRLQ